MEKKSNKKKTAASESSVTAVPVKSVADQIWEQIADLKIDMFALPNQFIRDYCRQIKIEPTKLYLQMSASSVLPSLEAAIAPRFSVERTDRYVVITFAQK